MFFNLFVVCFFSYFECFVFYFVFSVFLYGFVYCFSPCKYLFIFYLCASLPTTATGVGTQLHLINIISKHSVLL